MGKEGGSWKAKDFCPTNKGRTNHSLLYGAGLLDASFGVFLVNTMEFLSVRQKQRTWSGSHMVNTIANHSKVSKSSKEDTLFRTGGHITKAVSFAPLHQSLKQQAEKENWVWYALSARRREGLSEYGGWKWLTHHPSPPAAPTAHYLLCDEADTAYTGRTPWPRNAWHTELCVTLAELLQPHSQTFVQLRAPKRLHHHSLVQTTPSVFGLPLKGVLLSVYRYQAFWE